MKIGVLGSINSDIVYQIKTPPKQGETVFGDTYDILPGGKGANQAVIAHSLGDEVAFLGSLGTDSFGQFSLQSFQSKGISIDNIAISSSPSGIAIIQLTQLDNSIVVIPGANQSITLDHINRYFEQHHDLSGVVTQHENNLDAVELFLRRARNESIPTILNPAPANALSPDWQDFVDILIPNEHEARLIFKTTSLSKIVSLHPNRVVITLGDQGAMFHDGSREILVPAKKINVVDTTGAGDSFVAGFSSSYFKDRNIITAIKQGIEVASITCQYLGAQGAYDYLVHNLKK